MKLEEKTKEVEQLEELKGPDTAPARWHVYTESIKGDEGEQRSAPPLRQRQEGFVSQPSVPIFYLNHSCLLKSLCLETNPLILLKRFHPSSQAHISQSATFATSNEASNDLVKASAEAVTTAWFPEPSVFLGDPLKLSFQTLIDHKNLPAQEKLFFLHKYVLVVWPRELLKDTTSWLELLPGWWQIWKSVRSCQVISWQNRVMA